MRQTRHIMGMPVHLEIVTEGIEQELYEGIFDYLTEVDERFSTYKEESEISRINRSEIESAAYSKEMKEIFVLAERTSQETNGYFNVRTPAGIIDPSGIVKGWAIQNVADLLLERGITDFYIEIAGDIQTNGLNSEGKEWSIGIRNPFAEDEIVKVVYPKGKGIATSGTYARGAHIYNPLALGLSLGSAPDIFSSLTVIGPNIYEADRFATAAFAMGMKGMDFLEELPGFEAYAIRDRAEDGAVLTSGFDTYTITPADS